MAFGFRFFGSRTDDARPRIGYRATEHDGLLGFGFVVRQNRLIVVSPIVVAAEPIDDQRNLADAQAVSLGMVEVFRERRHPVVLLPIESLVRRIADHPHHPFVRAIAGQVGRQSKLPVLAEFVAAAGAVLLDQANAAADQLGVFLVLLALVMKLGLSRESSGDSVYVIFESVGILLKPSGHAAVLVGGVAQTPRTRESAG